MERPRKQRKLALQFLCACVAFLLFVFGFGLISSVSGNTAARKTIVDAFDEGAIAVPQNYTTRYGGDAYTDCLVLNMSIFRHRSLWLDAFDTFSFSANEAVKLGPCDRMRFALDRNLNTLFDHVESKYEYTRYWFGQRYLFQLMVSFLPRLQSIRLVYAVTTYDLIVLLAVISFARDKRFGAIIGSIMLCLILGFGVDLYGQSIAHAPACIWTLLVMCFLAAGPKIMQDFGHRMLLAFVAGAGLIYFETLAGSHPLMAGLFVTTNYFGYDALDRHQSALSSWKEYFFRTAMLLISFVLGCLYSMSVRFALAVALYDREVVMEHFFRQAKFRLSSQLRGSPVSLRDIASSLWDWRLYFFHGSANLATVTMMILGACSVVAVVTMLCLAMVRRSSTVLLDLVALLVPAAAIPVWFLLLPSHTVIHAWLMGRYMVVPPSFGLAGLVVAVFWLVEPHRLRQRTQSSAEASQSS